jgi:squalene synthase HpnC
VAFLEPKEFVRAPHEMERAYPAPEALAYTRWLATHHYENFHVVSFLLPKRLHQDFYNVYSFCRWADDLGDEIGDSAESLRLLSWWRQQLSLMADSGDARHPVFVALRDTFQRHQLPAGPFNDLISAFERDQVQSRYQDWEDLLSYCRCSANPVGRLVLMLCGYRDEERFRLSDATCTALQLANFWQDVSVDWRKDRVYLPQDLLARHGADDRVIESGRATPGFLAAMREAVEYAREWFRTGLPLAGMLDPRLALDIALFSRGGLFILDKIEREGFDVLKARPRISRVERVMILLQGAGAWAKSRVA